MLFFLLLLAAIFFFPFLFLPLLVFVGLFILFIPFKFTIDSFFNLFFVPRQIYKIATNPDLRKNHALEHATINVLEKDYGCNNLAGYAKEEGFYIIGLNNIIDVEQAARKGLMLMKEGGKSLAIHRRCGTSLTAANFVSAVIFLGLLIATGYFSILSMIIAIVISQLVGPFLGEAVQKKFTTTPDVDEMEIVSANYGENTNFLKQPVKIFVKTQRIPYVR